MKDQPKFVYVMTRPDGWHKIGVSVEPKTRRLHVSVSRGAGPVRVVRKFRAADPYAVEAIAHVIADKAAKDRAGEWFDASREDCTGAVVRALGIFRDLGRHDASKVRKKLRKPVRLGDTVWRKRGRPKLVWTDDQLDTAKRVWLSRDYTTNAAAAKHLPKGFTAKRAWELFGPSGRPFMKRKRR